MFLIFSSAKQPPEATLRGHEYFYYDMSQNGGEPIVSSSDEISLYFKTRQPNGVLFYTGITQFTLFSLFTFYLCVCDTKSAGVSRGRDHFAGKSKASTSQNQKTLKSYLIGLPVGISV